MSTSSPTTPDLDAIKQRQQATWATGDFSVVAARIVLAAENLCEAADLQAGWRVLDWRRGAGTPRSRGAPGLYCGRGRIMFRRCWIGGACGPRRNT